MSTIADDKARNDPEHFEGGLKRENGVVLKSDHDDLGIWATAWHFKKVSSNSSLESNLRQSCLLYCRQSWCATYFA